MRFLAALRGREYGNGYRSLPPAEPPPVVETPRREVGRIHVSETTSGSGLFDIVQKSNGVRKEIGLLSYVDPDDQDDEDDTPSMEFQEQILRFQKFESDPSPPPTLWDTDDIQYLDKVTCNCKIRITHIDPKNGSYEGRMKCKWEVRTLNTKERTEPRKRVPGIRLPSLITTVEESRIWRHFQGDSEKTVSWHGISVFHFAGYEIFEVHDFPFDRQLIDLSLFEFVWRDDKDSDLYHETMNLVSFTMDTRSMMPEWDTYHATIKPCEILQPGSGPTFGQRFMVKLRLERRANYYVTHIFMVSLLITVASILPLAFEPGDTHAGDRLYLHCTGLLTLVAFKYVVSHELPSVPYATIIDNFMNAQIWTLVSVAGESIFSYRTVDKYIAKEILDDIEDTLLIVLLLAWFGYFWYIVWGRKRKSWNEIMNTQASGSSLKV